LREKKKVDIAVESFKTVFVTNLFSYAFTESFCPMADYWFQENAFGFEI
jgi:hypothetical protein